MGRETFREMGEHQFFRTKYSKLLMVGGYLLSAQSASNSLLSIQEGDYKSAAAYGVQGSIEIGISSMFLRLRRIANSQQVPDRSNSLQR